MKKIIYLFLTLILPLFLFAQTATNVIAKQVGNTVEVTYDLDQPAHVTLLFSRDGGASYTPTPKALTGDVGINIQPGHKKIVWNLFSDDIDWEIDRARFKVMAEDKKVFSVNGVSFAMIRVEGGTFNMGATSEQGSEAESDEKPTHQVTLSDYYIGQTEVTQGLWKAVMGTTVRQQRDKGDSSWLMRGEGDNYPMYYINWDECQEFVNKLNVLLSSQLGGKRFALPTEAQWEYAARGGKKSNGYKYSGSNTLSNVAWYTDNSSSATHPVGTKSANELGIYDMSGNVLEWCQDWYEWYSSGEQTNPKGASSGSGRVMRDGSCYDYARDCRVSNRYSITPTVRGSALGLRLVCQ